MYGKYIILTAANLIISKRLQKKPLMQNIFLCVSILVSGITKKEQR